MRVIGGKAKGTTLLSVPGESTRPILDRVKTALFDTIRPILEDASLLDLFGGSGSVGIEALSQGASHATFIEINAKAVSVIRKNLEKTRLLESAQVRLASLKRPLPLTILSLSRLPSMRDSGLMLSRALLKDHTSLIPKVT
jgi:16S rRNA (guanine(966)-N(2))-methyltransferase RsmD